MADLSITATAVILASGKARIGNAGTTITAGEPLYKDTNGNLQLAGAGGAAVIAVVVGISLNGASAGQPVAYAPTGSVLTINAVMTAGQTYVLSATAGKIAPVSDLATGNYVTHLGVAASTTSLPLIFNITGQTHA
jgi:hypothetical protein